VKDQLQQHRKQSVDQKSHFGWGFDGVCYFEFKLSSFQTMTKNCNNWVYICSDPSSVTHRQSIPKSNAHTITRWFFPRSQNRKREEHKSKLTQNFSKGYKLRLKPTKSCGRYPPPFLGLIFADYKTQSSEQNCCGSPG
jgi:hypothetical protein